jgi:hypothetical protein
MTLDHAILLQNIQMTYKFATRSFNDKPVNESAVGPIGKELFEKEQDDLLSDLKDIPKKACDRRVSFVISCIFFSYNFKHINLLLCNCRSMSLLNVLELPRSMLI